MSYTYRETPEEIIIDKGIATREMWKDYDGEKEHVSYEELAKACALRDKIPIVLDTRHDHHRPLTDAGQAIGSATLRPCPEKRGLSTTWRLFKHALPEELLALIRERQPLPVSIFQFANVEDGEQRDLLFDHIAILQDQTPRCPITRCGVGVYDAQMSEKETAPDPATASTEAVPEDKGDTKPQVVPKKEVQPEPPSPDEKDRLITELQDKLAKRDEQIAAVRKPLVDELVQRGYQAQELNPLSLATLEKMVQTTRAASTEGLPGTVPAPTPETPRTLTELRDDEQTRFEKALKKQAEDRFKDW